MTKKQLRYLPIKRMLDIILSLLALIVLSPILLIVSILIKIDSKGPILFKQKRGGKDNTHFNILKFRTMRTDAPSEAPTDQLNNATSWITKTGKVLRKTSIDELPQLINILKGEMSIVGPRPALWNQHNLIKLRTEANVHTIKPGLTGWAQINGRDENDDKEKVYWDKQYLEYFNFMFDIKCVIGTVSSVFGSKGIIEGGTQNGKENTNYR